MLDAHSLRAYPVAPLALVPLFTEIREGVFSATPIAAVLVVATPPARCPAGSRCIGRVGWLCSHTAGPTFPYVEVSFLPAPREAGEAKYPPLRPFCCSPPVLPFSYSPPVLSPKHQYTRTVAQ